MCNSEVKTCKNVGDIQLIAAEMTHGRMLHQAFET